MFDVESVVSGGLVFVVFPGVVMNAAVGVVGEVVVLVVDVEVVAKDGVVVVIICNVKVGKDVVDVPE